MNSMKELINIKNLKRENIRDYETVNVKGFDVFFFDTESVYGYYAAVFKNDRHVWFLDQMQLRHYPKSDSIEAMRRKWVDYLEKNIFTFEELDCISDYHDYKRKIDFLVNHYPYTVDSLSVYSENYQELKSEYKYSGVLGLTYFYDMQDAERQKRTFYSLSEKFNNRMKSDFEFFKQAVSYELENHEACITYDYKPALDALGLRIDDLSAEQKNYVLDEIRRQSKNYTM